MSTTVESVKTPGDRELVVELLNSGLYAIKVLAPGNPPKITEQRFTNKREASAALRRYLVDNAKALEKAEYMNRRHPKKVSEDGAR